MSCSRVAAFSRTSDEHAQSVQRDQSDFCFGSAVSFDPAIVRSECLTYLYVAGLLKLNTKLQSDEADAFQVRIDSNDFFADLISGPKVFAKPVVKKTLTPTQKIEQQLEEQKSKKTVQDNSAKESKGMEKGVPLASEPPTVEIRQKSFDYEAWAALSLVKPLLKAIDDLDFERPTKIQAISIPMIFSGKDVLGSSVTGSGKTAAYLLPILQQLFRQKSNTPSIKAVIVLPTRELAIQCFEMFKSLNKYTRLSAAVVIGKIDLPSQELDLRRSPDIVFATPGRSNTCFASLGGRMPSGRACFATSTWRNPSAAARSSLAYLRLRKSIASVNARSASLSRPAFKWVLPILLSV